MFAIRLANSLPIDALKMAQNTAEAEWFCGTRGGMMDHATMMFGEKNAALKLTFNPFTNEIIPLPKEIANGKFTMLYTHPSEKGGEILMAFNELSFVAREIVPRLLPNQWNENWTHELEKLPNIMSKEDVRNTWPNEFQSFQKLYPALFESDFKIRIADRFQFAMKEFERSKLMQNCLQNENCTIQDIGNIMNKAWVDAGELYGIRTELMDSFAMQAKDIPGVFGIKVMGAGFGGNLLILSERGSDLSSLGKERLLDCSAGDAATILDVEALMPINEKMPPLAAVLLCGGKGTRMLDQGIDTHKPLLKLNGVPSTKLVVSQLLDSDLDFSQIIIVIPPERKNEYVDALDGLDVKIVIQHNALGTGNAVYCALDELLSPIEQIYVSFGTQPLVRSKTIVSSLAYHQSKGVGFTLPTTLRENPYAPLLRDANGVVIGSIETHLDGVEMPAFGETNVGGYWVSRVALEKVLSNLHAKLFDEENNVYKTNSGELGFPNEMTKGCLEMKLGVEGIAIADPEEVVGLKTPEHIGEIERWLNKPWRR
jgi:CTP:molybdopterin cytidylyltransferase MocA